MSPKSPLSDKNEITKYLTLLPTAQKQEHLDFYKLETQTPFITF